MQLGLYKCKQVIPLFNIQKLPHARKKEDLYRSNNHANLPQKYSWSTFDLQFGRKWLLCLTRLTIQVLQVFMLSVSTVFAPFEQVCSNYISLHWSNYSSAWNECSLFSAYSSYGELDQSQTYSLTWPHHTLIPHGDRVVSISWLDPVLQQDIALLHMFVWISSHRNNSKSVFYSCVTLWKKNCQRFSWICLTARETSIAHQMSSLRSVWGKYVAVRTEIGLWK